MAVLKVKEKLQGTPSVPAEYGLHPGGTCLDKLVAVDVVNHRRRSHAGRDRRAGGVEMVDVSNTTM